MVRVRVRLGYTVAICLVLQHQVSPSFLESSYSLSHFANLLHALFRHAASRSWGSNVAACLISSNYRLQLGYL